MKNGNICEVTQQFIIGVERDSNIPLNFALYKDAECTEIIEKDENGNFTSDELKLKAGQEETKTYYLKVTWPAEENDKELAYEIGYFTINVITTQVD